MQLSELAIQNVAAGTNETELTERSNTRVAAERMCKTFSRLELRDGPSRAHFNWHPSLIEATLILVFRLNANRGKALT
jgi:hypothetical protein